MSQGGRDGGRQPAGPWPEVAAGGEALVEGEEAGGGRLWAGGVPDGEHADKAGVGAAVRGGDGVAQGTNQGGLPF